VSAYSVKTVAGRKAFDRCVEVALTVLTTGLAVSRTAIADHMKIRDVRGRRNVSAALKRGVADGWACVTGKGAWSMYRRAP
jgi:hypothetical protein